VPMTTTNHRTTADLPNGNCSGPFLVLGATGKTGRLVAARLAARSHQVRAASRRSATRFDWNDKSTWVPALDGTRAMYLVPPDPGTDVDRFVDLAAASDVGRIALLSARNPGQSGDAHLAAVEAAVTGGSTPWVILRPSWFAQNFNEGFLAAGLIEGTLRLPVGDGREPFIDTDDIASVAVAALTDGRHEGCTYELSGPETLSFAEAVTHIAVAAGRSLDFVDVEAEQYAAELAGYDTAPALIATLTHLFAAIRAGDNDYVSNGVEQALGREPTSFTAYAARVASTFT